MIRLFLGMPIFEVFYLVVIALGLLLAIIVALLR